MNYAVSDIVKEVRVALDKNYNSDELEQWGNVDTLMLNEIIESKIPDAARYILLHAPLKMFDRFTAIPTEKKTIESGLDGVPYELTTKLGNHTRVYRGDTNYVYTLTIPDDYLRLVSFAMSDWTRPVSEDEVIESTSPFYALQTSKIEGVRGNPEKPVVALVIGGTKPYLRAFSTKPTGQWDENNKEIYTTCNATYIPMPEVSTDKKINLPPRLYRSIVYATAYFTALAYGVDNSTNLSIAKTLAEIADPPATVPQVQQPQETNEQ